MTITARKRQPIDALPAKKPAVGEMLVRLQSLSDDDFNVRQQLAWTG